MCPKPYSIYLRGAIYIYIHMSYNQLFLHSILGLGFSGNVLHNLVGAGSLLKTNHIWVFTKLQEGPLSRSTVKHPLVRLISKIPIYIYVYMHTYICHVYIYIYTYTYIYI